MKERRSSVVLGQLCRPRYLIAAMAAAAQSLAAGCAPTLHAMDPVVHPQLGARPLRSIAVMPVDLWVDADDPDDERALSESLSHQSSDKAVRVVSEAVRGELAHRGYRLVQVGWDGTVPAAGGMRRSAIPPSVLEALDDWMLDYGRRTLSGAADPERDGIGGALPFFDADATLFVGGDGHLHEDESNRARTAKEAVIGVAIGVLVVAVVAVLALALAKGGGGGLGGLASGAGKVAEVGGRAALAGARLAVATTRVAVGGGARLGLAGLRVGAALSDPRVHLGALEHADFGRGATSDGQAPPYQGTPRPASPEDARLVAVGAPNVLRLGATLVDNHTGAVLWSGAQVMEVDPVDPRELRQATQHILERLPTAH